MDTPKAQFKTIDEYINAFPEAVRATLQSLRQTINEAAPEARETMKYGMPTFTLNGNLVYFAAWKTHIALYPATATMEATIPETSPYKTGKGTFHFPLDQPLPLPLIRKIVEFRVKESQESKEN